MPKVRSEIRYLLGDVPVSRSDLSPEVMLLDALREGHRLTGTKEGCGEGDCGACTVLVGRLEGSRLRYQPVNACIRPLASLDGCHIVTVEHLSRGDLAPVQEALVRHHGSQCGFCTPGIVMSLHGLWMEHPSPSRDQILRALQGNLCRCTGYAPIIKAAQDMASGPDPLAEQRSAVTAQLKAWQDDARVEVGGAILPADVDDLAAVLSERPEATIVCGATDVGLWVTKSLRRISPAVFLGHLAALQTIEVREAEVLIGAGVTYTDLLPVIEAHFPTALAYVHRIGGWQVRNMGTIGGNIANGSPIGDMPPWLIAMEARVSLRKGDTRREVPLEEFFIAYGKQDRVLGEFVESIGLPRLKAGERLAVEKISKRRDEDISTVSLAIHMADRSHTPCTLKLVYGGMAGVPKRATAAEAALSGLDWRDEQAVSAALLEALPQDFAPLSDWRGSAEYRMTVARTLVLRAFARFAQEAA